MNNVQPARPRVVSRLGIGLCIGYLTVVALCVLIALASDDDPKGRYVLLQLPIALQASPFLGQGSFISALSWIEAYTLFGVPTLVLLYVVGHLIGAGARHVLS